MLTNTSRYGLNICRRIYMKWRIIKKYSKNYWKKGHWKYFSHLERSCPSPLWKIHSLVPNICTPQCLANTVSPVTLKLVPISQKVSNLRCPVSVLSQLSILNNCLIDILLWALVGATNFSDTTLIFNHHSWPIFFPDYHSLVLFFHKHILVVDMSDKIVCVCVCVS